MMRSKGARSVRDPAKSQRSPNFELASERISSRSDPTFWARTWRVCADWSLIPASRAWPMRSLMFSSFVSLSCSHASAFSMLRPYWAMASRTPRKSSTRVAPTGSSEGRLIFFWDAIRSMSVL